MKLLFIISISIICITIIFLLIRILVITKKFQSTCKHPNLVEWKWIDNGTCMIGQECRDCGFFDCGHVHADPETWFEE